MSERIIQFGDGARLSGVLCEGGDTNTVPVLLFNAGVIHRIGAHRLNVKLARALCDAGAASLRFDLSGLGESASAPPNEGYEAQAIADISAAGDALAAQSGISQFVSIGMCSGADNSYRAALSDKRITHLVLLDPYAYANEAAARADMLARVTSPDRWARKLTGMFSNSTDTGSTSVNDDASGDDEYYEQGRSVPAREDFGGDLKSLTDRGVKILIIYTGLVRSLISKPEHFFQVFQDIDFSGMIDVEAMPHTDHTFTQISAQRALIEKVVHWISAS